MNDSTSPTSEILVVGAGMAAHRFVERLLRDPAAAVRVTVIGDEGYGPYDRSALVGLFSGVDPAELQLDRSVFSDERVRLIRDDRVLRIDPAGCTVRTRSRRTYSYDTLVLATGSYAARVAVDGANLPGCFVLHTIDDVESVRRFVDSRARILGRPLRGAVIGGGLHGVEAAVALNRMGVGATVVQYPHRLMPTQLDRTGAGILQGALEEQGITVRTRTRTTRLDADESGAVTALEFQDGSFQRADVVLFTVGVRPRDELARNAGLEVHPRGGVIIDDRCATSDPNILAIGAAACFSGRPVDSAAPAQAMAEVVAARLRGGEARFLGHDDSAHHTAAGVDLACFGESLGGGVDVVEVVTHRDRAAGVYRKLVLTNDARTLVGGVLVGDTSSHDSLRRLVGTPTGELAAQLWPGGTAPDDDTVVCVHIGRSHRELVAAVQAEELSAFSAIGARFGREHGCERCTLAMARVLTELAGAGHSRGAHAREHDAVDALTRLEPDGTHVALPSVAEGALTPAHLVAIGQIAEMFGLRPRLVGARIELQGARSEQVASLQEHLTAAGLGGGHRVLDGEGRVSTSAQRPADVRGRGRSEQRVLAPPVTERSRNGTVAIDWSDRARKGSALRGSPLRAENPA